MIEVVVVVVVRIPVDFFQTMMDDTRVQVAQLGGGFIGADSFFHIHGVASVCSGWRDAGESPVHAHHGLGKLADVYVIGPEAARSKLQMRQKRREKLYW